MRDYFNIDEYEDIIQDLGLSEAEFHEMSNTPIGDWTLEQEEMFIARWGNDAFLDALDEFFAEEEHNEEDDWFITG